MYGRRLLPEDYKELLRKQTVPEVAAYLKQQTSYAEVLKDSNENLIHRGQLEMIIRRGLFAEYTKVFHYAGRSEIEFYSYLVTRMEIDEILSCMRFLNAGRQGEYIFSLPSFLTKRLHVDLYALAKVRTVADLQNLLRDTRYCEIIDKFPLREGSQIDTAKMEVEFDRFYYDRLFSVIDAAYDGEVKTRLRNAFAMEIDLWNIISVFRLKKYFDLPGNKIRPLLLPYRAKLGREALNEIMSAPDAASAWNAACKTYYGRFLTTHEFNYVEEYIEEILYGYHKSMLMRSSDTPVVVVSYLHLKIYEIQNLIHIIEGIRYGLEPSEIAKLLVGTGQ